MIFTGFKYKAAFLVTCLLVLVQCKRPDDPVEKAEPAVFGFEGTLDGNPFKLEVNEEYYMFARFDYSQVAALYTFSGRLEKARCNACGPSLEILINDAANSNGTAPADINLALQQSTYAYADITAPGGREFVLQFAAEDSGYINPAYSWSFGGAKTTDSTKATATVVFPDTATREVCLTITDNTTLCTKTICNRVKPFEVDKGDSMVPDFSYVIAKTIIFLNASTGNSFLWAFGDGGTSAAYNPEYLYKGNGTYRVCLTSTYNGVVRTLCKNVVYKDAGFTCRANFSYKNPAIKPVPKKSKIKIRYRDETGEEYHSDLQAQPGGSYFNLLSHAPYTHNERGQKTRRLSVAFQCRLYSKTGAYKDINITNGAVAVAYP